MPTAGGTPSFLAQSFDATGTLLVGTPLGVYRSSDGGRTWHTTQRHVWGALAAGFTQASTIVSRGRLLQRGNLSYDHVDAPKRSPFHGGSVLALSWLPGGKLYALVRGTYWHLYVTLDSARTWYPRPALGAAALGARDRGRARQGRPRRPLRGDRPRRPVALGRRRRELVAPAGAGQRAVGRDHARRAGSASSPRCPSSRGRTTTARPGTRAARAPRSWPRIRATSASGTPIAPDGELLVSTDGGRSW